MAVATAGPFRPGPVKTTVAVVPPAPAPILSRSTSRARDDSVPGMENAPLVGPERVTAPRANRPSRTAHRASIARRRRNEKRPSRYRRVATLSPSLVVEPDGAHAPGKRARGRPAAAGVAYCGSGKPARRPYYGKRTSRADTPSYRRDHAGVGEPPSGG